MKTILRPALVLFALLTVLCCALYPAAVTGIGRAVFPDQIAGSLVLRDGQPVGSSLIGQAFTSPKYFWGRPSATAPMANNGLASGGSNQGPNNPALLDAVKSRIAALHAADPDNTQAVPVDLVTASGSGLDPEISLAAAAYQLPRIARERKLSDATVQTLIDRHSSTRVLGFLGEPRVNVLALNMALDAAR
ncbi:potassium-transporting ATPase subunit KdpC [Actimicrobium sp. CCC2.4]|uniref:potassium-transporting ATPase subunit KdpC n=1 Tax=Actimicrobium sp. CCC2.4 TaxID=3048606 RepID=UPI002AC9942B|nr:potassium-transporting ATPase subunit KdpC [Actimicrobium sp. CCC2.4]MEB0134123.1 potassium-transporting ATPase subunit KdpC [Actimicrobium sp. CCC2.4]WPX32778.1 potassium-transporting ATPase subunit KdpC [Actimicrobium sp. CCC2.4]